MPVAKEAKLKDIRTNYVSFHKSCRDAIFQILTSKQPSGIRVLLPAYIGLSLDEGSGVLDPIKESGASFDFYPLSDSLEPLLEDFARALEAYRPTHTVLIHYFGWTPRNAVQFANLASSFGVQLIHDYAHAGFSLDYVSTSLLENQHWVFSIHKTAPTRAGGVSVSRLNLRSTIAQENLEDFGLADFRSIARTRRNNSKLLFLYLRSSFRQAFAMPYNPFSGRVTSPLNLPVLFSSRELREKAYEALTSQSIIPTALYHRLVPEIEASRFPQSISTASRILNLPTHQDVQPEDLRDISRIIRSIR